MGIIPYASYQSGTVLYEPFTGDPNDIGARTPISGTAWTADVYSNSGSFVVANNRIEPVNTTGTTRQISFFTTVSGSTNRPEGYLYAGTASFDVHFKSAEHNTYGGSTTQVKLGIKETYNPAVGIYTYVERNGSTIYLYGEAFYHNQNYFLFTDTVTLTGWDDVTKRVEIRYDGPILAWYIDGDFKLSASLWPSAVSESLGPSTGSYQQLSLFYRTNITGSWVDNIQQVNHTALSNDFDCGATASYTLYDDFRAPDGNLAGRQAVFGGIWQPDFSAYAASTYNAASYSIYSDALHLLNTTGSAYTTTLFGIPMPTYGPLTIGTASIKVIWDRSKFIRTGPVGPYANIVFSFRANQQADNIFSNPDYARTAVSLEFLSSSGAPGGRVDLSSEYQYGGFAGPPEDPGYSDFIGFYPLPWTGSDAKTFEARISGNVVRYFFEGTEVSWPLETPTVAGFTLPAGSEKFWGEIYGDYKTNYVWVYMDTNRSDAINITEIYVKNDCPYVSSSTPLPPVIVVTGSFYAGILNGSIHYGFHKSSTPIRRGIYIQSSSMTMQPVPHEIFPQEFTGDSWIRPAGEGASLAWFDRTNTDSTTKVVLLTGYPTDTPTQLANRKLSGSLTTPTRYASAQTYVADLGYSSANSSSGIANLNWSGGLHMPNSNSIAVWGTDKEFVVASGSGLVKSNIDVELGDASSSGILMNTSSIMTIGSGTLQVHGNATFDGAIGLEMPGTSASMYINAAAASTWEFVNLLNTSSYTQKDGHLYLFSSGGYVRANNQWYQFPSSSATQNLDGGSY